MKPLKLEPGMGASKWQLLVSLDLGRARAHQDLVKSLASVICTLKKFAMWFASWHFMSSDNNMQLNCGDDEKLQSSVGAFFGDFGMLREFRGCA